MLTIKNGRIYAEEFSFILPEGMSFYYDSGIELRDCLQFISADKKTILDVRVVKPVPLGTLEAIAQSEVFIPTSEIFSVNRGGLKGKAMYFRNRTWDEECYGEHFELRNGLTAEISLSCEACVATRGRIREILSKAPVSDFLANVKANK